MEAGLPRNFSGGDHIYRLRGKNRPREKILKIKRLEREILVPEKSKLLALYLTFSLPSPNLSYFFSTLSNLQILSLLDRMIEC